MECHISRTRQVAYIRVSDEAFKLPRPAFEQAVIHELVHIVVDQVREEAEHLASQIDYPRADDQLQASYCRRHTAAIERAVEHLSLVLYNSK
jgi:hypothetical protein